MLAKHFKTGFQVRCVGRRQFKIQDETAHGDKEMQAIAKDSLFFCGNLAESGSKGSPVSCRTRYKVKLNHWSWQTVDYVFPIQTQIQAAQDDLSDQGECLQ